MKAYDGLYPYAFMSYSHKDEAKIRPLIEKLQRIGCNIWYDEGIIPADEWAETVAKKLAEAKLFFLILSPNSIASQNVKREIYFAVSKDIPILTYYLEDTDLSVGLSMQLGVSQAVRSQNDLDTDCNAISAVFPKDAVDTRREPEIIYSTPRFSYGFICDYNELNEYSIIRYDRETREKKTLFRHIDSRAFCGTYKCESVHFSPRDEFNPWQKNTLFFTVYADLDPDLAIAAPELYVHIDFAVFEPQSDEAELVILGCRKKKKDEPYNSTEVITDFDRSLWTKNFGG